MLRPLNCFAKMLLSLCGFSDLSNNQVTGSIPESLGNLTGLTYLCVLCRRISLLHAALTQEALRSLICACSNLFYNQGMSGSIPSSLGSLTALQTLYVRGSVDSTVCVLKRHACLAFPQQSR
jgi:Leucine-rich repeat (LRR) protein